MFTILKRILPLLGLLLVCAIPSRATISKVQIVAHNACGVSLTCATTIAATGTGHFAWIMASNYSGAAVNEIASVSDGSSTWVVPAGCAGFDTNSGTVSCAYTLSQASGITSVTVTWGTATPPLQSGYVYEEASFTGSGIAFDTSGYLDNTSASSSASGVTLTLSGSNDVIMQYNNNQNQNASSINGSYTDFNASDLLSEAGAHATLYNSASGTAPTWTMTGSTQSVSSAIAFKETAAGNAASKIAGPSKMAGPSKTD